MIPSSSALMTFTLFPFLVPFLHVSSLISAFETTNIAPHPLYSEPSVYAANGSPSTSHSDQEEISQSIAWSNDLSSSIAQNSQLSEITSMAELSVEDLNVCIAKSPYRNLEANVLLQSIAKTEQLALDDTYNASVLLFFV
jgi:hypothetical protein